MIRRLTPLVPLFLVALWRFRDVLFVPRYFASDFGDNFQAYLPFFSHFIDSLEKTGSIDPWNPYVWGGMAGMGNPNIPFNPVLYGMMHLGRPGFIVAMNVHLFAEFFLAALGMYCLLRIWIKESDVCFLTAVAYVFSSAASAMFHWNFTFFVYVAVPWVLWILLTINRRSLTASFLSLAGVFYYQVTYGQLQLTLYSWEFFVLAVVWWGREYFPLKRALILLVAGMATGCLLGMHYLLPVADTLFTNSNRLGYLAGHGTVPPLYLLNLLFPRLFWKSRATGMIDPAEIGWWPKWADGWSLQDSFVVYVGLLLVCLWIFSLIRPRSPMVKRLGIFSVVLIALNVLPLGGYVLGVLSLFSDLPYGRITVFLIFPILISAAVTLSELRTRFRGKWIAGLLIALFVFSTLEVIQYQDQVSAKGKSRYPFDDLFATQNPVQQYLKQNLDPSRDYYYSMLGTGTIQSLLTPNLNALHRIPAWNGYTSVVPQKLVTERFKRINVANVYPEGILKLMAVKYILVTSYLEPYLSSLYDEPFTKVLEWDGLKLYRYEGRGEKFHFPKRVEVVASELQIPGRMREKFDPEKLSYASSGGSYELPSGCNPNYRILPTQSSEFRIQINNPCATPVMFAGLIPLHHWWRVFRNGQPVDVVALNRLQTGINIPPGSSLVEARLFPTSYTVGKAISWAALGLLILVIGIVVGRQHSFRLMAILV